MRRLEHDSEHRIQRSNVYSATVYLAYTQYISSNTTKVSCNNPSRLRQPYLLYPRFRTLETRAITVCVRTNCEFRAIQHLNGDEYSVRCLPTVDRATPSQYVRLETAECTASRSSTLHIRERERVGGGGLWAVVPAGREQSFL